MNRLDSLSIAPTNHRAIWCADGVIDVSFPPDQPLQFHKGLSRRLCSGSWLWIQPTRGNILVLNDEEDEIFRLLLEGMSPAEVLTHLWRRAGCTGGQGQVEDLWGQTVLVVERLLKAGLVVGTEGLHDVRKVQPHRYARLHMTGRCQLRCIHCYASSGPEVTGKIEASTSEWITIIDDIASHGGEQVVLTGGEPLLRSDIGLLMRRIRENHLHLVLLTNGLLVKKLLPDIRQCVHFVQVSLGGPSEACNDLIRGRGTFRRIIEAVKLLLDADVPVRVGITVMEQNWDAVRRDFPAFARSFAGTRLQFHLSHGVCSYGRAVELANHLDLERIQITVEELLQDVNPPTGPRVTRTTAGCGYCEQLVVGPDAMVYPCHLLDEPLGHVRDMALNNWHTRLKRTAEEHSTDRMVRCRSCDLRHLCPGTCRVINQRENGDRLMTTCSDQDREMKYRALVRLYGQPAARHAEERG